MQHSSKRLFAVMGIGFGVMVLGMIWSIVNTALASIQKDLSADLLHLQWMMNCFGIFLCVPLLTMGKLGDTYGRKRLFIYGLYGALAASIIAGLSPNIYLLIACMGLYGLSGSMILPLSQALLVHQYPENEKEKAVGIWSIFCSLSLALGPLLGGIVLDLGGWRWVYLINVPLILLIIPTVRHFVEKEVELHKPHCDWEGVALLATIVGSFVIAIMQGPSWGWGSTSIIGLWILTGMSLFAFIYLEKNSTAPLFRPDLFLQRSFLFSAIPNGCMLGFVWVTFFLIPLYLQNIQKYSPLETGIILLLATIPVALLSTTVSKLYKTIGPKRLLFTGFTCLLLSALLQAIFITQGTLWPILLSCFCLGMGWVITWGPSIACAVSSLPHKAAGMASGMFTTAQELGAVLSLAIAGVIFRQSQQQILEPSMNQINSALRQFSPEEIDSLLSDPASVEVVLGSRSSILPLLQESFLISYQRTAYFLVGLSLLAILLTFFLHPKKRAADTMEQ